MPDHQIYDEAMQVDAEDGAVTLKGPGDIDVSMTPAAAEESSQRLFDGAMKARGQRYFTDDRRD